MLIVGAGLLRDVLLPDPVHPGHLGIQPAESRLFLPTGLRCDRRHRRGSPREARDQGRPPYPDDPSAFSSTSGLFWLSHVTSHSSYATGVLLPILLIGAGIGLVFRADHPHRWWRASPSTKLELAVGACSSMGQQIGGSLGIAILVTVATSVTPRSRLAGLRGAALNHSARAVAVTAGYEHAFQVSAFIMLGAFIIALLSRSGVGRDELPVELALALRLARSRHRPAVAPDIGVERSVGCRPGG